MKIVYIGTKPQKADNIAATGLVWARGQIHEVEEIEKAEKLLKHPLIWVDADKPYALLPELAAVEPSPRVQFVVETTGDRKYFEPLVVTIDEETFKALRSHEVTAVYLTDEDAEAFTEWRIWHKDRPPNTALEDMGPLPTGPLPDAEKMDKRTREYREYKERLEAEGKKVA